MLDYTQELERLRPHLGDAVTDGLIARERREIFSVYPEVRIAAWGGALLIAAAAGVFITNNFGRFDPLHLAIALGILAVACYAWVWRGDRGIVGDYVLLLGALLVSADVGFIEQQYDLFGANGARHLLLLAIFHAFTAYRFGSRLVLSVSLAALAAWMGLDRNASGSSFELSMRAFGCAAIVLAWRAIHVRFRQPERLSYVGQPLRLSDFPRVFEHFAANFALWGGLLLLDGRPLLAAVITTILGALVMLWGFRTRVESFVLYGFLYAVIADTGYGLGLTGAKEVVLLIAMLTAIIALVVIHRRFQRGEA